MGGMKRSEKGDKGFGVGWRLLILPRSQETAMEKLIHREDGIVAAGDVFLCPALEGGGVAGFCIVV